MKEKTDMTALHGMTQVKWDAMTPAERDAVRSDAGLSPQLVGLEGCRVEVVRLTDEIDRFQVGKSTGWVPCHLELANRASSGGGSADREYKSVHVIRGRG